MATINVIYDDLYNSAKALDKVIEYIESAKKQLETIKKSTEELDAKHDCFSRTSTELNDLEIAFENYNTEVGFLKSQCTNAANAFKDAEGENAKLTDAMKGVISDAAIMLGDDSLKNNPEINAFKNREEFEKSNTKLPIGPVKTSETRNNTFVDNDNDKYVEVNGDISKDASTIIDPDEKSKEEDKNTDTSSDSTPAGNNDNSEGDNYTGGSSSGGSSSGGHHSGGDSPNYTPTYTPTNTDKSSTTNNTPTDTTKTNPTDTQKTTPTNTDQSNTTDPVSNVNLDENNQATNSDSNTTDSSTSNTNETEETITDSTPSNTDTTNTNNSSNFNNTQQPNQNISDYSQLDANGENSSAVSGFQPTENQDTSVTPSYNYTGGSYSEDTGYTPVNEENGLENMTSTDLETPPVEEANNSIDDIIKKGKYTKIPTSSVPIQPQTKSTGNAVIPIAAGISAAAAAGIGAKAYMDHKNNSVSDDDIDTEDWSEDDSLLEIDENDSDNKEELSSADEYTYQQETEKYSTRDTSEITEI